MKQVFLIAGLTAIFSCKQTSGKLEEENYKPIAIDTSCQNIWSDAFFELGTKNFNTLTLSVKNKLVSVLGSDVFTKEHIAIMQDSLRKSIFPWQKALSLGELQIDTTDLISMGERQFDYYANEEIKPGKHEWERMLTQTDLFTFQNLADFDISYTIYPCIKKLSKRIGKFKRWRKGSVLPEYAQATNGGFVDQVFVYSGDLNLAIHIRISDKTGILKVRNQFYEVKMTDSAKIYSTQEL